MGKMLRYITVILFTLGIILSIGGFLLDKADKVPFVLKIFAPEYSDGLDAFNELMNRGPCINEDEKGFSTLAKLSLSAMEGNLSNITIKKICRTGAITTFSNTVKSGSSLEVTINIENTFEGIGTVPWLNVLKMERLMNRGQCTKESDNGFSDLANTILTNLGENISNLKIVKICGTGVITNYNNNVNGAGLIVVTNKEQTLDWFSFELEPLLKNSGENSLFVASFIIFSFGIILNLLSFIIERRKDKDEEN